MNQKILKASSIQSGDRVVIGGKDLWSVISVVTANFSDAEREYLFGDKKNETQFVDAQKVVVSAVDVSGESSVLIFSSTDNVALVPDV
ncbi:hypothetical protein AAD048_09160 [Raoultella ornithinolytica]|uniref:hypothetical protein n=1 Tax=Raoultella ornithinolytica TaxID=54291 RepID=UPI0038AA7B8D